MSSPMTHKEHTTGEHTCKDFFYKLEGGNIMPSTLPVIRIRTHEDNVVKMKTIAKYHKRSVSKEIEMLIEQHIEQFEKKYGEIDIYTMNTDEVIEDIKNRLKKNPPYGDK